ncbi:helix-turn-helix domain-containing protein [Natronomonas sp. LN261]|uniref:winged helix-turn-helix domain-containing protein n=1 Tax=Natronomonas sp. LN261 TaxID=2750669 RepID=UPI0015EE7641|nr:helix-turn-helix domain-containing protein [Natronomonas sp. LN261]
MVRDPLVDDDSPDMDTVLGALHDEDCRAILAELGTPRTARELLARCEIPRSTLYRKLDQLSEATLLRERTEIRSDGSHATQYQLDFEDVVVTRTESAEIEIEIKRPARKADERLAEMWSEVGKEL